MTYPVITMDEASALKKMKWIWALLLCVAFPLAILLPFVDITIFRHTPPATVVPFEYSNALLFTASILFGFTSLIVVSKEWIDKRIWTILVPPLFMLVLSGIAIGNLAIGANSDLAVLELSSATFNANVVSTGFVVGYVAQRLPKQK